MPNVPNPPVAANCARLCPNSEGKITSYNCTSLLSSLTSSPGLKAGIPIYGQPLQRNASPRLQFPHEPTFPCTVKSTSVRSSAPSFSVLSCASAVARLAASSAAIRSARPQEQSLQARRRLPTLGTHSGAVRIVSL
jgi:hypothetical protein